MCLEVTLFLYILSSCFEQAEVYVTARSPPASLPFKGQVTERTTVAWPISYHFKLFLYKSPFYKSVVAEIYQNFKNILRT